MSKTKTSIEDIVTQLLAGVSDSNAEVNSEDLDIDPSVFNPDELPELEEAGGPTTYTVRLEFDASSISDSVITEDIGSALFKLKKVNVLDVYDVKVIKKKKYQG